MSNRVFMPVVRPVIRPTIANSAAAAGEVASIGDRFREVTGVAWDRLWVGDTVDVVERQSLIARESAVAAIEVVGLAEGFDRALGVADNTGDAFDLGEDLNTGNSSAAGIVWAIVFRSTTGVPPASRSLVGNRSATAPNAGMELLLTTTGGLVVAADGGAIARFVAAGSNYADEAWHVAIVRDQGSPATTELATERESGSDGPGGNPAISGLPWTIGRRRLPSAGVQVAVAGISSAGAAMSSDLVAMAAAIHGAVIES